MSLVNKLVFESSRDALTLLCIKSVCVSKIKREREREREKSIKAIFLSKGFNHENFSNYF